MGRQEPEGHRPAAHSLPQAQEPRAVRREAVRDHVGELWQGRPQVSHQDDSHQPGHPTLPAPQQRGALVWLIFYNKREILFLADFLQLKRGLVWLIFYNSRELLFG